MTSLTIVIVNYRTADLVVKCLRSIEPDASAIQGLHVVVVDNASGDGSADAIRIALGVNGWTSWVTFIESPRNGGFSAGNNIGIRARCSKLYLLLNPDTIVKSGAIQSLIDFFREHPRAGIVGSHLEDVDGTAHSTARRCLSPLSEFEAAACTGVFTRMLHRLRPPTEADADEPVQCDWVSGAAMCVRREVFDEVGLLDEGYFLYFEELDLCERARRGRRGGRGGWEVWSLPNSRIMHIEGASTGISDPERTRPPYWYDSRRRFFLKRHGVLGLICADVLWGLGRAAFAIRRSLKFEEGRPHSRTTARDLFWGDVKTLLTGQAFRIARGR